MKHKIIVIIFTLLFTIMLTSCAIKDGVEINKREYIFAVGIDKSEKEKSEYTFTAEVPLINTGSEDKRFILSQTSQSLTDFYYENVLTTDKMASDSLMQVIVLGEDVVKNKDSVKRIFDEIERSPEINRKVKIVVAKNKASDIISFKIEDNPLVGRYISEFLIKLKKLSFQTTYSFDEVVLYLQGLGNALIPSVEIKDDRISIDGAAVIKGYKLIDYIDQSENSLISLLTKGAASGMKDITVEVDGVPITLTYESVIVSQNIDLNEDKLSAKFYATVGCNMNSYDITRIDSSDKNFTRNLVNAINKKISAQTDELVYKMQNIYGIDLLGIQEDLIKYKKIEYDKIHDKYEEVFKNAKISINYNIKINNSGMVK